MFRCKHVLNTVPPINLYMRFIKLSSMAEYYTQDLKEVFSELKTSEKGLSQAEAEERLKEYGPNAIVEDKKIHPFLIFLDQFKSPIVWILIAAMLVSLFVKEYADFAVIAAIVVINAVLGFFQEYKAEEAIAALKKMISKKSEKGGTFRGMTDYLRPLKIVQFC